jgi:HK97 family phage major capsid protein
MGGSLVQEIRTELRGMSERMNVLEKNFLRAGREREDTQRVVKNLLTGAPDDNKHRAIFGWDGADATRLIETAMGYRQKSLGGKFKEFLDLVSYANDGKHDIGQVEKSLSGMHSRRVEKASLAESSGATGGYTVPVQFYADLLRFVAEESFVRNRCTTVPMASRTMWVPAALQSITPAAGQSSFFAGIQAFWQPEAASITESDPQFRQIQLTARDLVFITVASNQLLQDNAVSLDTLLSTMFKECMAWTYDYYLLRGNGAGQPLGVINSFNPALIAVSRTARGASGHFTMGNAGDMLSHFLMSGWTNGIWIMHPSVIPELITMSSQTNVATTSASPLVWMNPYGQGDEGPAARKIPGSLFGMPIFFTEKVPQLGTQGDVSLLDMSKQLLGDRLAIQIESSPWPRFTTNQMMWRVIARWDAQPWLNAPIILADGGQNYQMSPFISLAA